jgi:hypothetical protein
MDQCDFALFCEVNVVMYNIFSHTIVDLRVVPAAVWTVALMNDIAAAACSTRSAVSAAGVCTLATVI